MMSQMIRLLCLLLFANILCAQNQTTSIKSYTLEDGLSHNQISWLHKDKRGMLWVGTFNGINRYDGKEFKYVVEADFAHLTNKNVLEDEQGDLWLLKNKGQNELFFFNTISEEVKTFEDKFGPTPPFQKENFSSAILLADQVIVVTKDQQLISFNLEEKKTPIKIPNKAGVSIYARQKSTHYWLVSKKSAILKNQNHAVVQRIDSIPSSINIIGVTKKHHLIYRDVNKHIYTLTPSGEITKLLLGENDQIDSKVLPFHYSLNQSSDNILQIIDGKLNLYDLSQSGTTILSKHFHELEVSTVPSTLKDEENIWVGSINGLFKIQILNNHFKKGLFKNPANHFQKNFNSCRGMLETNNGDVYVSTNDGVFNIRNGAPLINKPEYSYYNVFLTKDSILWTNYNSSNFRTNLKTGEQKILPSITGIESSETWSFFQDDTGKIWGGTTFGLIHYEEELNNFENFTNNNGFTEIENSIIYDFFVDQQKQIWLASSSGLYQLDLKKGIVERYWKQGKGKYAFPTNKLQHIHQDKKGIFWIASRNGLVRWDKENATTQLLNHKDGFSNSNLNAIFEDDFGFLWMSSDNGIIQFQKETFKVKNYHRRDGITHPEFNRSSHHQDKKGNIYFGGLNGVTYFHPKDFVDLFEQPVDIPLLLTECKIFSDKENKQEDRLLDFHNKGKIFLAPNDRYLMLQFALLDYYNSKAPQYVYEIDGEPFGTSKENSINISALPYGNHTLTVKARTSNGFFSSQVLSIPIEVLKPFYVQSWFIASSILALVAMIVFYQKMKTRRLLLRQEALEKTVTERTQTIQQQAEELLELDKSKSRFLANISHELRTPLTLILNTINDDQIQKILAANDKTIPLSFDQTDVNIMQRNANRLQQLIDQLLDLSKLEAGKMTLRASKNDFYFYLNGLVNTFQSTAQKKNIQLTFESLEEEIPIYFERDKMDKIVYNLLANAIKFTPQGGNIKVSLWQEEDTLYFSISDTGIGIPKQDLKDIFNRFYQVNRKDEFAYEGTGLGLALVKELVEIHSGKVEVTSELAHGTCFKITLPLGDSHLKPEEKVVNISFSQPAPIQKVGENNLTNIIKENTTDPILNYSPILLVIEDNQDLLHYHQKVFEQEYQVILTQNGNEGIEKALEIIPDIIICDIMMPGKNGYEVCKTLKTDERTNHIPLILLTAKTEHEEKLEGLVVGADDYITKPYDQRELSLRIRNQLAHIQHLQQQFTLERKENATKTIDTPQEKFILKVYQIIAENFADRFFGVTELSVALNMSRSQLFRKVKAISGKTPNSILRTYRLNRAKELLIEEDGNATNVSYLVGFNNPNYFFKCFKDEFALTPGQYMEQIYKKQES